MKHQNYISRNKLKEKAAKDTTKYVTVSFYKYVKLSDLEQLKETLFSDWSKLNCLGRIYIASEGINAQMCVPEKNWNKFVENLYNHPEFKDIPFKIALEEKEYSFYKLTIKIREKIVADGLDDNSFDSSNIGQHLEAEEFNKKLSKDETIVIDVRNHYESEIGHFQGALCPDADTFREELPMIEEALADKNKEEQEILLYCTGGIRCEKTSAYLKHKGYKKVYQLKGGIINYTRQIKEKGLPSKFIGKNFVFDERMGERVTEDIISNCHQCEKKCDDHTNCKNDACHLLFIQCKDCAEKYDGCCTEKCQEIIKLPIEEQRKIRKGAAKKDSLSVYKSRLRPKLNETTTK